MWLTVGEKVMSESHQITHVLDRLSILVAIGEVDMSRIWAISSILARKHACRIIDVAYVTMWARS